MTVTKIEEISKSRCKIEIDFEFAFVLYKGELRLFGIQEGEELEEKEYTRIVEEVLPKRATKRAMNLLKSREYTTKQMVDKLRLGGYPETSIDYAVEYVSGYHYIDDLRYAATYIRQYECSKSKKRLQQDLLGKGISRSVVDQAFAEWEAQGNTQDEQKMIEEILRKKGFQKGQATEKEVRRMYQMLLRKGFSSEIVNKLIFSDSYFV